MQIPKRPKLWIALALLIAGTSSTHAAIINSAADPLLAGATLIDFSEVALFTTDPTILGVSFTGVSNSVIINNDVCVGLCLPNTAPVLTNQTSGKYGTDFIISFASGVSAFGFGVGAINSLTTLDAFDSSHNLLGTVSFGATSWDFVFAGLGGFGSDISSAHVRTTDFITVDNLLFTSVPEPPTLFLIGVGLAGLGFPGRRRNA